jgi:hypothetical protein
MPKAEPKWCVVCGSNPVRAKDRCTACYFYLRRTGEDRPEGLAIRANVRRFDQQAETDAWGGPMPERQPSEGERLRARAEEAARERRERRTRG